MENRQALIVEIGNSFTELALFEGFSRTSSHRFPTVLFQDVAEAERRVQTVLQDLPPDADAAVCSVVPSLNPLFAELLARRLSGRLIEISSALSLPFTLEYRPEEALGADRLALCSYVRYTWPREAVIALDIGTALTCDVIRSSGDYLGGMILPGIDLMASALHERTAKLPEVSVREAAPLLGRSTEECIRSGVFWGAVKQVSGLVPAVKRHLAEEHGEGPIRVVATGGDSRLIASAMEEPPEIEEDAVLKGARILLDMNRQGEC